MTKNILITGVAGLLGSRFADWLLENKPEYNIFGVDDLSGGYKENVDKNITFYNVDVSTQDIKKVFNDFKYDYVFHFAAYAAEGLSPFIRNFNYRNNLIATTNIVNECIKQGISRLIFTSTLAVYGHGKGGVFDETQTPTPIDPYGVAKFACEMDIHIAGEQHGLDWCILRPHNVYGAKQNIWDRYRNVLGIWMCQILNNEDLTIYGDGTQTRAFSYIDDSLPSYWEAAVNPKASREIINIGGIKEYTINEACNALLDITKTSSKKVYLERRHEVKHAITTYQKSVELLNFIHKTDLYEGIDKMWKWAKVQPKRKRILWDEYEIDKGMYSFWRK